MLADRASIKELSTFMGHKDPASTLKIYSHKLPDLHDRARQAVDAVFGRPGADDGLEAA